MDVEFKVGDKVLVKLQPCRQHFVALRKKSKIEFKVLWSFPNNWKDW